MEKHEETSEKKRKITEGPLGIIIYALLGVFIAFLVNMGLGFALTTDLPVVAVVSSSMQHDNPETTYYDWLGKNLGYNKDYIDSWSVPTGFLVGDMPIIQGSDDYKIGDVIVYTIPGQSAPIIHRIIAMNPDGTYQTKGDNNLQQLPYESSVSKEQIHGKVIFIVPKLGYFKVVLTQLMGG